MEFQYPYALILLFLIPGAVYFKKTYRRKTGFSAVAFIPKALEPRFIKKYSADSLGMAFIFFSILALANIRYSSSFQETYLESRWIMIVQDLSGSMNRPGDEDGYRTLGDISLEAVKAFTEMRQKDDLIGLIAFSSYAKLISPPTFDKAILKEKIDLLSRKSDSMIFRELSAGGGTNASYAAWLAICTFFMLLPEENRLSFEELRDFRYALLGETLTDITIPDKLKKIEFGHGMAVVLFTDGRIEADKSSEDIRKGLPNFVNVVQLMKKLGIKLYLIVVGGEVTPDVKSAIENSESNENAAGRIFYMPRSFDLKQIKAVYSKIHEMEKNRLLLKISKKKKDTRKIFAGIATGMLIFYGLLQIIPRFRTI
jgi:hypothetical protein